MFSPLRLRAFSDSLNVVTSAVLSLLHSLRFLGRSRASLHLEVIALRHQLAVLNRSRPRPRLTSADRMFWAWLSHACGDWRSAVHIVKPDTVIRWHRRGFRLFWTWKSRQRTGRPGAPADVRALINPRPYPSFGGGGGRGGRGGRGAAPGGRGQ